VLLVITASATAQPDKRIESQITKVTVFLNKAQVTREVKTRIEAGKTNLIFSGLTSQLDPNSIQVSGKGDYIILGISHQQNYLKEMERPGRLQVFKDSIKYLQGRILFENTQKEILNKEEQMLLSNQKIGGANQNLPVNELKNMADFFRARLNDIAMSRIHHDENISLNNERLLKLQQQMQTENELEGRNTSEIVVSLAAENDTNVELVLDYIVANAGWYALYDLRAVNTKTPLSIAYKANVFQSTGEVWKNVRLKLSTANPTQGGLKPELDPWYVDFFQPQYYPERNADMQKAAPVTAQGISKDASGESETVADFVNVLQTSLNTEFDIALPYTVNSENKPTTVDIGHHEMTASYKYSVAPKLDADAFLLADATGWEEFNLLPGEANVFLEGTFVGKTYLDPQSIRDTLHVSLGRDKRIAVKRNKLKDVNSRAIIGINQKETYGYEITVRNNKSESILITVEDPIPVSMNSQIEVSLRNSGGGKYNPVTGKLVWEIALKPNESRRLAYDFEVKYPKDKLIAGLN
jgi:uncharacterized protein (TIGR02231 family)